MNVFVWAERRLLAVLALATAVCVTPGAHAGYVSTGQSRAYGVAADVDVALQSALGGGTVNATVASQPVAQGTAPAPYSSTPPATTVSVTEGSFVPLVGAGNVLALDTGLMTSTASSNVDGLPGTRFATASSEVDGLGLGLVNTTVLLATDTFLSVSADTLLSTSTVSGDYGSLSALGSSSIENLIVRLNGVVVINMTGTVESDPNTILNVATSVGTISVILNEQIATGNGVDFRSIETNALHIVLQGVGVTGTGTLNGDVIVAHSEASLNAVPEPTSLTLVGLGLLPAIVTLRRATRGWKDPASRG